MEFKTFTLLLVALVLCFSSANANCVSPHTVVSGDTCWDIATRICNIDLSEFMAINGQSGNCPIYPGQVMCCGR